MKQYFYSDNNKQVGPFTLEELKSKRLNKSTLVWTDGFLEWITADKVDELKGILTSSPPPLPNTKTASTDNSIHIKLTKSNVSSSHLDYRKEVEATVAGVSLIIFPLVLKLSGVISFETEESYTQAKIAFGIVSLAIRIITTFWVIEISKRQNRNTFYWCMFTFFLPSISLIIIGFLNKLPLKIEIDGSLSIDEQADFLKQKADELKNSQRFNDAISILLKIKELKPDYSNIDIEIDKCRTIIHNVKLMKETPRVF